MSKRSEERKARVARGEKLLKHQFFVDPYWVGQGLAKFRKFIAQDRMRSGWNGVSKQDVSDMLLAIKDRETSK